MAESAARGPRLDWQRHGDLIRTQLQETGRVRLSFLRLADLDQVVSDLGIDPDEVRFLGGYAVVGHEAYLRLRSELAEADRG